MYRFLPLVLLLAACAEEAPSNQPALETEGPSGGLPEMCDAPELRPALVGQQVSAVTLPATGPNMRIYADTDLVIDNYIPQRTNIVYDGTGRIYRVWCG